MPSRSVTAKHWRTYRWKRSLWERQAQFPYFMTSVNTFCIGLWALVLVWSLKTIQHDVLNDKEGHYQPSFFLTASHLTKQNQHDNSKTDSMRLHNRATKLEDTSVAASILYKQSIEFGRNTTTTHYCCWTPPKSCFRHILTVSSSPKLLPASFLKIQNITTPKHYSVSMIMSCKNAVFVRHDGKRGHLQHAAVAQTPVG